MDDSIIQGTEKTGRLRRKRRWRRVMLCMAALVVFCTTYALILPAITMEKRTLRACEIPEHTHTSECYTVDATAAVCPSFGMYVHEHTEECFEDGQAVCGYADFFVHSHDEHCYDENGVFWCELPEITEHIHDEDCYSQPHEHSEDCYAPELTLICGLEENSGGTDAELICGKEASPGHSHEEACYDEAGELICGLEESEGHSHTAECIAPAHKHTGDCYAEEEKLVCGLEEDEGGELICGREEIMLHEHDLDCYDASWNLNCGRTQVLEHQHTDECRELKLTCGMEEHVHGVDCPWRGDPEKTSFEYADEQLSLRLEVESWGALPENAELLVSPSEEEQYLKFAGSLEEEDSGVQDLWILRDVCLSRDGEELDSSEYGINAGISLSSEVLRQLWDQFGEEMPEALTEDEEAEFGIDLFALQEAADGSIRELGSVILTPDEAPELNVEIESGTLALRAAPSANPEYEVQYYAYFPRMTGSADASLSAFDTTGRNLPYNGDYLHPRKTIPLKRTNYQTDKNNGQNTYLYEVSESLELTKMYSSETFRYIKAPNTSYVNKLEDNTGYSVQEIWVLKDGRDSASVSRDDWDIYSAGSHFTNRAGSTMENMIYISDGTVIRLVYRCESTSFSTPATFYDYDISSGWSGDRLLTGTTGINIKSNYTSNSKTSWDDHRDVIAFGNSNCGTGMGHWFFAGGYLNAFNKLNTQNSGCTFKLADRLEDEKIVYNEWVLAPNLFNEGNANGKKTYSNSSLTFKRVGDCYTLSSATIDGVGTISQLDRLFNPSTGTTVYTNIWTNDFWPLDGASAQDPMFGNTRPKFRGFVNSDGAIGGTQESTLPPSDDGNDHNCFFGMQYIVTFKLTEDYEGPLDYTFFGDDDMWVFLDDTLICDIGGVHSSVGEYVDLWDYLEKGVEGSHKLTFFYTERGASGSTCFMNFTLPSVTGVHVEQKTTSLTIRKEVEGESDPDKEFDFNIRFYNKDGDVIWDDYAYERYDQNGNSIESELIIHDGGEFSLKAGEYVVIKNLPIGLRYTVTETTPGGYSVINRVNGVLSSGPNASGTIIKDAANEIIYTNTTDEVNLILQKTDPDGSPLAGAVFTLSSGADGPAVNFVKKDEGSYAVPAKSSELIDTDKLYYIASALDTGWVLTQRTDTSSYEAVLHSKSGADTQKFRVYEQSDGSYSFQSVANDRWLDLHNGLTANYQMIHFYTNSDTPTSHDNQKWFITVDGNGYLKIKPRVAVLNGDSAVMDLNGALLNEGTSITAFEDNGTMAQRWILDPVDPETAPGVTTQLETDSSGKLQLAGLLPGTYTLREVTAPDKHILLEEPIELHIDADGNITLLSGDGHASVENGVILKVSNSFENGYLTLEKEVRDSDTDREFEFSVSYIESGGTEPVTKTIRLANGGSEILEIPYGAAVTIRETEHKGFSLSFMQGSVTMESDGDSCSFIMTDRVTIRAVNQAGYELPETGGPGVLPCMLGGLALIAGAVLPALIYSKRRRGDRTVS